MTTDNEPNGVRRRRVLLDGVVEEWDAAMGRVLTIPADPRPRKIDLSVDAAGWERLRKVLGRLRG
jgi:hypothetical protein